MSDIDIEKLSYADLQKLAKERSIRANQKKIILIKELGKFFGKEKGGSLFSKMKTLEISNATRTAAAAEGAAAAAAEGAAEGTAEVSNATRTEAAAEGAAAAAPKGAEAGDSHVKWFRMEGLNFAIGISLYNKGLPIVSGDNERTFIKVYMQWLPKLDDEYYGKKPKWTICQLFYSSSGYNSKMKGIWIPTDGLTLHYSTSDEKKWSWYIQKKPWLLDEIPTVAQRFGGDPSLMLVSLILGGFSWHGSKTNIDKLKKAVTAELREKELKKRLSDVLRYSTAMADHIQDYLKVASRKKRPLIDEYDIDMWVGSCTSYNWFRPYVQGESFIPNMDPRNEDGLWLTLPKSKLRILKTQWLNSTAHGKKQLRYLKTKDLPMTNLSSVRRHMLNKQIGRLRADLYGGILPKNLKTREELQKRRK